MKINPNVMHRVDGTHTHTQTPFETLQIVVQDMPKVVFIPCLGFTSSRPKVTNRTSNRNNNKSWQKLKLQIARGTA